MSDNRHTHNENFYQELISQINNHPNWEIEEYDSQDPELNIESRISASASEGNQEYGFEHTESDRVLVAQIPSYGRRDRALSGFVMTPLAEFANECAFQESLSQVHDQIVKKHDGEYVGVSNGEASISVKVPFDYDSIELNESLDSLGDIISEIDGLHDDVYDLLENYDQ